MIAYLRTPSQFFPVQILKYIDCQLVRQLDIKEGHIIHFILRRKREGNRLTILRFANARIYGPFKSPEMFLGGDKK